MICKYFAKYLQDYTARYIIQTALNFKVNILKNQIEISDVSKIMIKTFFCKNQELQIFSKKLAGLHYEV